jgi:hypothetical protein
MGESRFRVPRRPQNAFLPEGEGQDEGEGGIQQPSRDLLFENPLPRLYPLQTSRNQNIFKRVAVELDGEPVRGDSWPRELLLRMKSPTAHRPALVSEDLHDSFSRSLFPHPHPPSRVFCLFRG